MSRNSMACRMQKPTWLTSVVVSGFMALAAQLSNVDPSWATSQESVVQDSFEKFVKDWMASLAKIGHENMTKAKIQTSDKGYNATFVCYGTECDYWIKPTGKNDTPYVGYLTYHEKEYIKHGATREEVDRDQGSLVGETKVTEIFRYSRGKWVY